MKGKFIDNWQMKFFEHKRTLPDGVPDTVSTEIYIYCTAIGVIKNWVDSKTFYMVKFTFKIVKKTSNKLNVDCRKSSN